MSLDNTPPEENKPEETPPEDNQFSELRDQYDEELPVEEEEPQSSGNRTFLTVIGIIGGIVVLAIIALVGFFLITRGQLATRFQQQAAQINAENTAVALQATESLQQEVAAMTQKAILPATWTATPQGGAAKATATPKPANTSAATQAGAANNDGQTATAVALLTQSVQGGAIGTPIAQQTVAASPTATLRASATATTRVTATQAAATKAPTARASATALKTSTALPQTGFAEDVGLPGMLGLALALVVVVFVARRIRLSNSF